ncbi:MAG: D-2-hydroxyacid dehydrogenase [Gemmatimonadetes bacterium]|nr:D-2-hydroxyacid dehydrogenase [Gemmatimonadota bacterium]
MRRLVVDLRATPAAFRMPDAMAARIRAAAPEGWEVLDVRGDNHALDAPPQGPGAEAMAAVAEAEVYFGWGMPAPLFHAAPRLRWVQSALAGTGALLAIPEMRDGPCLFTNAAGIYGPPIAEHVLAGVLHFTRALDVAVARQEQGTWDAAGFGEAEAGVREIGELRVLVIGTGGLGAEIGARFAALGAEVAGVRRVPAKGCPPAFRRVVGLEALDAELGKADVVILAAALTDETRNLLDARRLALLPAGAIVVNVARGTMVDETALHDALKQGHVRGAVLDVFAREPLAPESPLWQLRQVLLTPHVSGISPRRLWDRLTALFLGNWEAYVEGRPLRNLVDKAIGY